MISDLAGFTLTRTLPDGVLSGILSGSYKVFGGVVRDNSGQIIAHLANNGGSLASGVASAFVSPLNAAFTGMNTFQLHRIGQDVNKLVDMSQITMAMSGLNLAVSAAGFVYLNHKLNKINATLSELKTDVKFIRKFLEFKEMSKLSTAFKDIQVLDNEQDPELHKQLLIQSRKSLSECYELYKALLTSGTDLHALIPVEEYFILATIGYARCNAELKFQDQAKKDLEESLIIWKKFARAFMQKHVLGENPQRFLTKKYIPFIKLEEVATWLDFANGTELGIDGLDTLREKTPVFDINIKKGLDKEEALSIQIARKLVQREKVLEGYISQYDYYAEQNLLPSDVHKYLNSLSNDDKVSETFIFVNNDAMVRA